MSEYFIYDKRLLIDSNVLTEPRAWRISKINRIATAGLAMITTAQDMFDGKKDYIEFDSDGNVIGMWADYYDTKIEPKEDEEPSEIRAEITYSGLKPEIKVGGNYKKFTVTFYDGDEETDFRDGEWKFSIGDEDISNLIITDTSDVEENQIRAKFIGDDLYIGQKMTVAYESSVPTSIEIEIKGL